MSTQAKPRPTPGMAEPIAPLRPSLVCLRRWVEQHDFMGWEPYDILNSPFLRGTSFGKFPLNWLAIQIGKRSGWARFRSLMRVPVSKNPKALALFMSGYSDLARIGETTKARIEQLRMELARLRSPGESEYCWGYDWPFVSLRGAEMPAFSPNAIATVFCGKALLDAWEVAGDRSTLEMAESAGRFIATRLNRGVDTADHLCFSYTPGNFTRIHNSNALCCAFLARLSQFSASEDYAALAHRGMQFLADSQNPDGSWPYGEGRWQGWIDSFHTGFNLSALIEYQSATGDTSFEPMLENGMRFYARSFFLDNGAAKYQPGSIYPIDIHSCAQALLTLSDLSHYDERLHALRRRVLQWTERNMQSAEGFFYYQRHRLWTNQVPYMRWAQAWMFRALAHLEFCKRARREDLD